MQAFLHFLTSQTLLSHILVTEFSELLEFKKPDAQKTCIVQLKETAVSEKIFNVSAN